MGGCLSLDLPWKEAVQQACNCLFGDGNYIHMIKANLEALEGTIQELRRMRVDLLTRVSVEEDKGLERLAQVEGWLSSVESLDSHVSILLEDTPTEINRLILFGYFSENCISSYEYGKEVSKKLEEVKELLSKGVFKDVAGMRPLPKVEKKFIQTTVGLDSMVGKAWDSILKTERRTLGIYGMGGIGKTTLLYAINNKFSEELNDFDVVIWVVVSKDLQYKSIRDQILRRLRVDKEWEDQTEDEKVSSIAKILGRKKFILLLDDLWSEVDLSKIGVPHPTQENGSKIVFTTRSKKVCRDMEADEELKIDCLSKNEAWELFQNAVGGVPLKRRHPDIPALAKKISEKCYGLPLALNVIGKAMSSIEDVHEWRDAIDVISTESHEFPGMEEKILSILKFSYDGLKDEKVKSCFLYCSLFPEDYEITKEELIEYWISEGFIKGKRDEDGSNNQGHVIIGSLVRAHLLMEFEKEFTPAVKMHDVLREMALWVGSTFGKEEEKQCVKTGVKLGLIPGDIDWSGLRRISLMSNLIEQTAYCPECPHLSTLLLGDNKLEGISGNFFQFMPVLVVLDLSCNRDLSELPEEICSLTSLQYLNLSYTSISSLSVGLKRLRKLISLDLEFTWIESIDGIGTSLPNLQVLKLYHSSVQFDASSIEELQLLEHLKILTGNVIDALMLESIQRVERLASCVQRLWIISCFTKVVTLNTVALGGLRELNIELSKISEIKIDWKNKEKEDLLCNSSPCFKNLSSIFLRNLEGPKELTWLLFAPNLKHLHVGSSGSLEEIINTEKGMRIGNVHPDMKVPFQKLESLSLRGLDKLKMICSTPPALPSLKKFVVEHCRNLPRAARESFREHEQE
ncbi:Disease resistance protein (NBS-LRR class) family [Raphanus sativus]|nr:Disease resistance protein (NBS-LRR class) family [Raphanus sativus]